MIRTSVDNLRRLVWSVCLALLMVVSPPPAFAGPPAARPSKAGDRSFRGGDLDAAIPEWETALSLAPEGSSARARLLLNLSTAHELRAASTGRDDLERAQDYLSRYAQVIERVYAEDQQTLRVERARRRDRSARLAKKLSVLASSAASPSTGTTAPPQASGPVGPSLAGEGASARPTSVDTDHVEVRKTHPWLWVIGGSVVGVGGAAGGLALVLQDGSGFSGWSVGGLVLGLTSVAVGLALIVSGARKRKYGLHWSTTRGDPEYRQPRSRKGGTR